MKMTSIKKRAWVLLGVAGLSACARMHQEKGGGDRRISMMDEVGVNDGHKRHPIAMTLRGRAMEVEALLFIVPIKRADALLEDVEVVLAEERSRYSLARLSDAESNLELRVIDQAFIQGLEEYGLRMFANAERPGAPANTQGELPAYETLRPFLGGQAMILRQPPDLVFEAKSKFVALLSSGNYLNF